MKKSPSKALWEKPQGKNEPLRMEKRFRIVPRPITRFRPAAGRVFPLAFGRKPIGFAFLFAEPLAKRVGVVPSYVDHWLIGCISDRAPRIFVLPG